jgi:hypothetical protein
MSGHYKVFATASQQVRRTMVFLSALADYLVLSPAGNIKKAAPFYGAIEAWSERSGAILGSFYQELNRTRIDLARTNCQQGNGRRCMKQAEAGKEAQPSSRRRRF